MIVTDSPGHRVAPERRGDLTLALHGGLHRPQVPRGLLLRLHVHQRLRLLHGAGGGQVTTSFRLPDSDHPVVIPHLPRAATIVGIGLEIPWSIAYMLLPLVSWIFPAWPHLQLAVSLPVLLLVVLLLLPGFTSESPRWILLQTLVLLLLLLLVQIPCSCYW